METKSMNFLGQEEVKKMINDKELIIRPLLDPSKQIGQISIDLRLGTDFLISSPFSQGYLNPITNSSGLRDSYLPEKKHLGETIIIFPGQTVLASTLEYIKMPDDCLGVLFMRTSYLKLGFSLTSLYQPGYRGCLSIELNNHSGIPIELTVGTRIVQLCFNRLKEKHNYFKESRKYLCPVRPQISSAFEDKELPFLKRK